ncbi:MAG: hypothetical protein ABEH43_03525 [Flavobacteriales bacterium]
MANDKKHTAGSLSLLFIIFAVIFFIGGKFMSSGGEILTKKLPYNGGIIGPLKIKEDKKVLHFKVYQRLDVKKNNWSSIELELLDENKKYMMGFGEELWAEHGRDVEGYYWEERKSNYEMNITIPEKGKYYIRVKNEMKIPEKKNIVVKIEEQQGSSFLYTIMAVICLIGGVIAFLIKNKEAIKELDADGEF